MNKKISLISAYVLSVTVALFCLMQVISLFSRSEFPAMASYALCIVLSWGYLVTTIGHARLCSDDGKIAAEAGKLFAVIYSVFICIVYFSQLSVVKYAVLDESIVTAFAFNSNGSWLFVIDIVGYGIMAISTFFVGLSVKPKNKNEKILRVFLLIHGAFCVCVILPLTPIFLGNGGNDSNGGVIALICWCVMFFPIAFLSAKRFKASKM